MLNQLHKNILLLSILCLAAFPNDVFSASEDIVEEEINDIRWFEIEIIVYKPSNEKGFLDESWDKDLPFSPSPTEELIDFLQPYYISDSPPCYVTVVEGHKQCIDEKEVHVEAVITESELNNADGLPQDPLNEVGIPDNSVIDIYSLDEEASLLSGLNQPIEEKPFKLLSKELLQLSNEAASLARHPDYQVLTHIAWRQPVVNRAEALSIRIAGGQDLSETYQIDGNRRQNYNETTMPFSETQTNMVETVKLDENGALEKPFFAKTNLQPVSVQDFTSEDDQLGESMQVEDLDNLNLPIAKPNLWVPELDGDIKIYLNRFLHISTNLFLRKPGKEEVQAVDLELYSPELLSSFSVDSSSSSLSPTQNKNSTEISILTTPFEESSSINTLEQSFTPSLFSKNKPKQFSWEISDDFLETESEKIYVERLFNYSLKQSRKIRSGELHFFDHPLLGLFIIVRPYELSTALADENTETALSN